MIQEVAWEHPKCSHLPRPQQPRKTRSLKLFVLPCVLSRDKLVQVWVVQGWREWLRRNCPRHPQGITSTARNDSHLDYELARE